ncbi:MAG TPA: hypothetical protein PLV93_06540 [Microthrixaceae bacterium]|nr:hypothetical protein [Microthrixaceae bacterium]HNI35040.1 hypothetical protein [Microthrixaceae bacterium]
MQVMEKKAKCPLCGAKNPVGAPRCGICTRPLEEAPLPSQAVYQEALWSTRIASKGARKKSNPAFALLLVALVGLGLNYFVVKKGPDWLHEPVQAPQGSTWKEYRDQPDYLVDLPGTPMVGTAEALGSQLSTASVWVDDRWDVARDDNTRSVGAMENARNRLHAGVVVASGVAPADPAATLSGLVASLVPNTELAVGGVDSVQRPAYGEQFTLTTNFTGFPEPSKSGTVRATATIWEGRIYIAASFVVGGDDKALHQNLVEDFHPVGAPR